MELNKSLQIFFLTVIKSPNRSLNKRPISLPQSQTYPYTGFKLALQAGKKIMHPCYKLTCLQSHTVFKLSPLFLSQFLKSTYFHVRKWDKKWGKL
jgi:hypothetical protein